MITTGMTVAVSASIWQEGGIVSDIWFDESAVDDIISMADAFTDYYLKQMNFIGNLRRI